MFDYGNARLHAMKSRLLSRDELERLAEAGSLQGLIAALTNTPYRKAVEIAITYTTGLGCIHEALRVDLVTQLQKIRQFYSDGAGKLVGLVLGYYDIHNIKTILRGLAKNLSQGEILSASLPVGDLSQAMLAEIARAPGLRAAIDSMASLGLAYAQPLLKLRAQHPGAEIMELELALERWYYEEVQRSLGQAGEGRSQLSAAFSLDADLRNLLTVLRCVHPPVDRQQLQERLGTGQFSALWVGPCTLSFEILSQAVQLETLDAVVNRFTRTPYEKPLLAGLEAYRRSGRLSEFEQHLNRFRLAWMSGLIGKDPLGIGVFLGFLALKINEVSKIRLIAQGIEAGTKVGAILAGLEELV